MAILPYTFRNDVQHPDIRERIDSLSDYVTDNLSYKTFKADFDSERAIAIVDDLEKTEKILKTFGTLQKVETAMWYAGLGWTLRLTKNKTRRKIYLSIKCSNQDHRIDVLKGSLKDDNGHNRFNHSTEIFMLTNYMYGLRLDTLESYLRRLGHLL